MKNDIGIISLAGMLDSFTFTWALLAHRKLILPLTPCAFKQWVNKYSEYGNVNNRELNSWLYPSESLVQSNVKLNPVTFSRAYHALKPCYKVYNSRQQTQIILENILQFVTSNSACLNLVHEEYKLLGKITNLKENFKMKAKNLRPVEILCPDLEGISMEGILKLRKSEFLSLFWEFIDSLENHKGDLSKIDKQIISNILELVRTVKPNVKETIFKGIIGNLPSPIVVNPAAIASSVNEVEQQIELKKKHGWLFFLADMERANLGAYINY